MNIISWNKIMCCFILLNLRPLPLPSPKERVLELRFEEVLSKKYYLFSITYIE